MDKLGSTQDVEAVDRGYGNSKGANDVFGDEKHHQVGLPSLSRLFAQPMLQSFLPTEHPTQIHYKTLSWPLVAVVMITEIVTYGTLSLPSSLAAVGIVPGIVLIVFLGVFALYTSLILIDFKLNHPESMKVPVLDQRFPTSH